MAGTSKANLMQTATNAGATMTAAAIQAGLIASLDDVKATFEGFRDDVYAGLEASYDPAADAPRSTGGGGYKKSGGSGGGSSVTPESAKTVDLRHGKFAGLTLGKVFDMGADECAEYGYGEGDKTGRDYVKWLAGNDKNPFLQARAKVLLDA